MMNATDASPSTAIPIADTATATADVKERAAAPMAAPRAPIFSFLRNRKNYERGSGWKRGIGCVDFLLRICAFGATLAATLVMATADETLPFFTEHYQFYVNYADLTSLSFFVIGNAIAAGYLVLSLPFSCAGIICSHLVGPRLLLLIFDLVMVALTTAAGSAATSIVYLAHSGNDKANWVPICLRFDGFCQQISGAVVASFIGTLFFMMMVVMSALALRKH